MPISAPDMNQIRVDVLGASVDQATGWISTGPSGNRNALTTAERIINRAINVLNDKAASADTATNAFADRFNTVIGNESGTDQTAYDDLAGKNLLQIVAELYTSGVAGGSFTHTDSGTVWTVPHNLNERYVSVQVVNDSGNTVIPDIDYDSDTVCTLRFANSITGTARIRK